MDPKVVVFDEIWTDLKKPVNALISGGSVLKTVWKSRVHDIYHLCTAPPRLKLGEKLYKEIRSLLEAYVNGVARSVYSCEEDNILAEYENFWLPYYTCIPYLNHLFSFLNTRVVRSHKLNHMDVSYSVYGEVESDESMVEIGELALDLWRHAVVDNHQAVLSSTLFRQMFRARMGQAVNERTFRAVLFSLIKLMQFKEDDYKLYEDVFEVFFFKMSTNCFIHKSLEFLNSNDCSEFMTKVINFMHDEIERSHKFLHPDSCNKIRFDCRLHLLIHNIPYLDKNCRGFVQQEDWKDLSNMYQLLNPTTCDELRKSLSLLIAEFEEHLEDVGLAVMQSLQGEDLATQFVEAMLEFHSKYTTHIQTVFGGNTRFYAALDKACTTTVNFKRHSKATCRSADLLAKYTDELLRKGAKGLNENELEDRLSKIILLFNYISDKDTFQKFYSRGLAKRLLFGHFQSMDLEEQMINRLKQVCGYEYTSKLNRMFTDMNLSKDLNSKFSAFLEEESDRRLNHGFSINVVAAGSWPISHSDLLTFSLPQELEKCVGMFELFYSGQFCGRKITWMHNLSLVDLKFWYSKKPYLVTMEMYLMGVLLSFNNADVMSYREIRDNCQLPNKELLKQLQLLVDSKMLLATLPITDLSVFTLNLKFASKRTKFKILPIFPTEVIQEVVQTHMAVEEERRLFIQASIVRILKARKEMTHQALIQEVIEQSRTRFAPKISTIKKCIEMLMEKQYVERSPTSPGSYIYVA